MKTKIVTLCLFLTILMLTPSCAQQDTGDLWEKVEEAQKKGLPKTAIDHLKQIYTIASRNRHYGEALKAIGLEIVLKANIQGNKPEVKVNLLKKEIEKASPQMIPYMKLMLAEWYWQYYTRNRYRFLNRTATYELKEDDFTTWDLPKLFHEISGIYQDLLNSDARWKRTPLSECKEVLDMGTVDPGLRPTLFDFIAFKALNFYTSGEQAGAYPEDTFQIYADTGAFDEAEKFIHYRPGTTDTDSPRLHALKIYQMLIAFHLHDNNHDALLDADIHRLNYIYNVSVGEKKSEVYIERLKSIAEGYPKSTLASLAYYYWAQQLYNSENYVEALSIASKGKELHSDSYGGLLCANLIVKITAKELDLQTERIIPIGAKAKLKVRYRNIDTISVRVVKGDWKTYLKIGSSIENPGGKEMEKFLRKKPVASATYPLKPTGDYKFREEFIDLASLPPGFYRVLASYKKDFSSSENIIEYCYLWVSNIAVVSRESNMNMSGFVVDSTSGNPVRGAKVVLYVAKDYNEKEYRALNVGTTDGNGYYSFPVNSQGQYWKIRIYASDNKGSEFFDSGEFYPYSGYRKERRQHTIFFTDRAIYRPGQTIHFKGIVIDVDPEKKNYRVIPRRQVGVRFLDVNGQEITKITATSNDFGSFSGIFNAPRDRLMGNMLIVADVPYGSCNVRVEEYKRPKFSVELKLPEKGYKLNDEVEVTGEAMAYTGAPIDGAKVSYRVVREVRMPYWWYYYGSSFSYESQEIVHRTTKTDAGGKFVVHFIAKPDERVSPKDEPTFTYTVYADVTDSAGETRSNQQSIRLGYSAMEATMSADTWQEESKPVKIRVSTVTLDGKPLSAKGNVEIYALKQPERPVRSGFNAEEGLNELAEIGAQPLTWPLGNKVTARSFSTPESGTTELSIPLKAGPYRAMLASQDRFGNKVTSQLQFTVCNPYSSKLLLKVPSFYVVRNSLVEVGQTFEALWGTGYQSGRAIVEIFQDNRLLKRYWTDPSKTQELIKFPVGENLRGGFTVLTTFVRENRLYTHRTDVQVPWSNKQLSVSIETFRSKLVPGQEETWTLKVKGPGAEMKAAELVATLYDESLDAFLALGWPSLSGFFGQNYTSINQRFSNADMGFYTWLSNWNTYVNVPERRYMNFIGEIVADFMGFEYSKRYKGSLSPECAPGEGSADKMCLENSTAPAPSKRESKAVGGKLDEADVNTTSFTTTQPQKKMEVQVRKNLNELAFFYPHLLTDRDGSVKITFRIPEALTKWRFIAFAHGKDLESGMAEGHTITQKDLMVQPNPPRFLREGDILEFSVKVTNMVEKEVKGTVRLTFFSPGSDKVLDKDLGNIKTDKDFIIPGKQSRSFSWRITVPDGLTIAAFRAMAKADVVKDGEEGMIPVLSRRIFVSESIPLWIRGPGEKKFTFEKFMKPSDTLVNQGYTVQIASNPAWYAVQALPFLMEFPHECSEQVFNRLYANALARNIAQCDKKIHKVFTTWREQQPDALLSNLEKNQELKDVMLLQTPWVLQAQSESQAKRNIGILFEDGRINMEISSALIKLQNMQLDSGAWPWFPGGNLDTYITLYITTGFGRLKHLNVQGVDQHCAIKALSYLDSWILEVYREILKHGHEKENHLNSTIAMYLYGRSFFLKEKPVPQESKVAVDYFLGQGRQYWLKLDSRMAQGHLALALNRLGDKKTARDIMASIKERSQLNEEMGMFWGEGEISWWWYRAPIETQAIMIEAFDEIMNDQKAVEECKVWLLKQKQTQDWKTTKATADAIYGLLCRGENLLSGDTLVKLSLGGQEMRPEKIEEGTGFYEITFPGSQVKPKYGEIVLKKDDRGIAWGGAHWRYLEDISKVTPHIRNSLTLKKTIFVQRNTKRGPVIEPVKGPLEIGDLLKIRVELRVDRDMEYVHMRDDRGSGLEPINVLSSYKYQDGLCYYESTKDTAMHFYIDYLPKGTYVFEYPLRVCNRGEYQNGIAHIECMYAPEFNSHSESVKLEVK